ncbi:MAG: hypothetical protein ABJD07_09655 [Gemmatimonadaceae bacterium]
MSARGAGYTTDERVIAFGGCGSAGPGATRIDYDRTTCRHRQWVAFHLRKAK